MTDKERILIKICAATAHVTTKNRFFSDDDVHWEYINEDTNLKRGDIVCGITNPNHKYGIAFFEKRIGYADLIVKEIGTNKTSEYLNERFLVLRNFPEINKLCGTEYKTMLKVKKAFYDIDWRFINIKFESRTLIITMRKRWADNKQTVKFNYNYNCSLSKVTIKSIKAAIEKEIKQN